MRQLTVVMVLPQRGQRVLRVPAQVVPQLEQVLQPPDVVVRFAPAVDAAAPQPPDAQVHSPTVSVAQEDWGNKGSEKNSSRLQGSHYYFATSSHQSSP